MTYLKVAAVLIATSASEPSAQDSPTPEPKLRIVVSGDTCGMPGYMVATNEDRLILLDNQKRVVASKGDLDVLEIWFEMCLKKSGDRSRK